MTAPVFFKRSIFLRWIKWRGVSRGTIISFLKSLTMTSAALKIRFEEKPEARAASVFIEQGTITMASTEELPLAKGAEKSLFSYGIIFELFLSEPIISSHDLPDSSLAIMDAISVARK